MAESEGTYSVSDATIIERRKECYVMISRVRELRQDCRCCEWWRSFCAVSPIIPLRQHSFFATEDASLFIM